MCVSTEFVRTVQAVERRSNNGWYFGSEDIMEETTEQRPTAVRGLRRCNAFRRNGGGQFIQKRRSIDKCPVKVAVIDSGCQSPPSLDTTEAATKAAHRTIAAVVKPLASRSTNNVALIGQLTVTLNPNRVREGNHALTRCTFRYNYGSVEVILYFLYPVLILSLFSS